MPIRPRVGISQCLLGDHVRYDGGHKYAPRLIAALHADVDLVAVCPEVEVGMGTPREPIQLVASSEGARSANRIVRLRGTSTATDWTERMVAFARTRAAELSKLGISGFVLKSRSPSCGPAGVAVLAADASISGGTGLFAQALMDEMPGVPIEDEEHLADPAVRAHFVDDVRRYAHRLPR